MYFGSVLQLHGTSPDLATMTAHYLMDGDSGAEQSVRDMRALVDAALKNPRIYVLAREIVQSVPAYDDAGELREVYNWVLSHIRFVKGVIGKQSLQAAGATLDLAAGQCTDISILMAALLMSIGYPVRFVAVATEPEAPEQFTHIYPEVEKDGEWIPVDAAREHASFGVPPARVFKQREFSILDSVGNMPRLGDAATDAESIADAIAAAGQSAAQIIAASNQPAYLLVNGQLVPNPAVSGTAVQPVLQNTSAALGIPSLLLLGLGVWLLYSVVRRTP